MHRLFCGQPIGQFLKCERERVLAQASSIPLDEVVGYAVGEAAKSAIATKAEQIAGPMRLVRPYLDLRKATQEVRLESEPPIIDARIPFRGDGRLLSLQPDGCDGLKPMGRVQDPYPTDTQNMLERKAICWTIVLDGPNRSAELAKSQFEANVAALQNHLERLDADLTAFNAGIFGDIRSRLELRCAKAESNRAIAW